VTNRILTKTERLHRVLHLIRLWNATVPVGSRVTVAGESRPFYVTTSPARERHGEPVINLDHMSRAHLYDVDVLEDRP